MEGLKPCPFCGNGVYLEKKPLWRDYGGSIHGYRGCYEYSIQCRNCGCTIRLGGNDTINRSDEEAIENAIKAWNRRP